MNDVKRTEIDDIVKRILECKDAAFITEIYTPHVDEEWVEIMICVDMSFENKDLYDVINDIDEEQHSFVLTLSVEPDTVERGFGTVLWKRP